MKLNAIRVEYTFNSWHVEIALNNDVRVDDKKLAL